MAKKRAKKYNPKINLKKEVEFDDLINLSLKSEGEKKKKKAAKKKPKKK